jgi:hypothetical protein
MARMYESKFEEDYEKRGGSGSLTMHVSGLLTIPVRKRYLLYISELL